MIIAVLLSLLGSFLALVVVIALMGLIARLLLATLRILAMVVAGVSLLGLLVLLGSLAVGPAEGNERSVILSGAAVLALLGAASGYIVYRSRDWLAARRQRAVPQPPLADEISEGQLASTWHQAIEILPSHADLVRRAGSSCEALFRFADARPLDGQLRDDAVLIRRRVPELVANTALLWRDADTEERGRLGADLIDVLAEVHRIADRRAGRIREETHMELAVLRQRVTTHAAD